MWFRDTSHMHWLLNLDWGNSESLSEAFVRVYIGTIAGVRRGLRDIECFTKNKNFSTCKDSIADAVMFCRSHPWFSACRHARCRSVFILGRYCDLRGPRANWCSFLHKRILNIISYKCVSIKTSIIHTVLYWIFVISLKDVNTYLEASRSIMACRHCLAYKSALIWPTVRTSQRCQGALRAAPKDEDEARWVKSAAPLHSGEDT